MQTDVDRQIARSSELLGRVSGRHMGRRVRSVARRVKRMVLFATISVTAIILVTLGWAILSPIGLQGVMLAGLAIMVALILSIILSGDRNVPAGKLARVDFRRLADTTNRWLDAQRASLPVAALPHLDRIGARLDILAPQLDSLDPDGPASREVRILLAEHLPQLVTAYHVIPSDLRGVERNGRMPDRELADGLRIIEREMGEMSEELARGDLDGLAAHGRYLQLKYEDPDTSSHG